MNALHGCQNCGNVSSCSCPQLKDLYRHQAAAIAREYAALEE